LKTPIHIINGSKQVEAEADVSASRQCTGCGSTDWVEREHAEAVELLQEANTYVLLVVDKNGAIKILDGSPGDAGTSMHDRLCALSMLKGFAKQQLTDLELEAEIMVRRREGEL
jgi:hypothetical protein